VIPFGRVQDYTCCTVTAYC